MLKLFRKHQKEMLAVFMAGLLVIWLGGDAIYSMLSPNTQRMLVARSAQGKITQADQTRAGVYTDLIEVTSGDWRYPLGPGGQPLTITDWIVLVREADRLGVTPPATSVSAMVDEEMMASYRQTALRRNVKVDHILEAQAKLMSIRQAAYLSGASSIPSEATFRHAARNVLEEVRLHAVPLPAAAFVNEEEPVSEDEIRQQFESFREAVPGGGLDFGYVVSDAVKIEYIKIDRQAMAAATHIDEAALESMAREYWQKNKNALEFRRPPDWKPAEKPTEDGTDPLNAPEDDAEGEPAQGKDAPSQEDEASGKTDAPPTDAATPEGQEAPGEEPAQPEPEEEDAPEKPDELSPFFETWEEAREIAIKAVINQRADRAADRIAEWLGNQLREPWYGVSPRPDGFKTAPTGAASEGYLQSQVAAIPEKLNVPGAVTVHTTAFIPRDQASQFDEGLARATYTPPRGRTESLASLAYVVEGLATVPEEGGMDRTRYLSLYQPSPYVLRDAEGNQYLFRVAAVRTSQAPESLDEVRDRVVSDVRLRRAFDRAKAHAEQLRTAAREGGLKAAFDGASELAALSAKGVGFREPEPFSRMPRYYLRFGRAELDNVAVPRLGSLPAEIVDRMFDLEHADDKVAVFELEEQATALVVEWQETRPARQDQFAELRQELAAGMAEFRAVQSMRDWLSPQNVRQRNRVEMER